MRLCTSCGCFFGDRESTCPVHGGVLSTVLPGPALLDGKYVLKRCLGGGGMGMVAEALHVGLERRVAVKLLRPERSFDQITHARFRAEARALGRLDHPNIVRVTDFGIDPRGSGVPYLVMELLEGETLAQRIARCGAVTLAEALPLLEGMACALDHAHAQGIVHGDFNPGNVWIASDRRIPSSTSDWPD
jgi:serine/threonine protein kinase